MIGFLFGAGASYGSQSEGAPPLGAGLYKAIMNHHVGSRRQVVRQYHECVSLQEYLSERNTQITQHITIDGWVSEISRESRAAFYSGDFETGLRLLTEAIASNAAARRTVRGFSTMVPGHGELDEALPERIMRAVSGFLYEFTPAQENLYRKIVDAAQEDTWLWTLNYDSLLELVAFEERIDLYEDERIKQIRHPFPIKRMRYAQLHGGVTLCSAWSHDRMNIFNLTTVSQLQRIRRRCHISEDVSMDLDCPSYNATFRDLAALSFYNPEKSNVISPDFFQSLHAIFERTLHHELTALFVIGCRYTPHDIHLWKPITTFVGPVFWCGDQLTSEQEAEFAGEVKYLGAYFRDATPAILAKIADFAS